MFKVNFLKWILDKSIIYSNIVFINSHKLLKYVLKYFKLNKLNLYLEIIRKIFVNSFIIIPLILLLFLFYKELKKDLVVIDISNLSKEFIKENKGFSNENIRYEILDNIQKIHHIKPDDNSNQITLTEYSSDINEYIYYPFANPKETFVTPTEYSFENIQDDLKFEVKDISISFNTLMQYLKSKIVFKNIFKYRYCHIIVNIKWSNINSDWIVELSFSEKNL